MIKLYPTDDADSKYPEGYTPIELDSAAAAKARILAALEIGCTRARAEAVGLNGSDDVATVNAILDGVLAEQKKLMGLNRTAKDYETQVAAACVDLDSAKWLAARPKLAALEMPEGDLKLPK